MEGQIACTLMTGRWRPARSLISFIALILSSVSWNLSGFLIDSYIPSRPSTDMVIQSAPASMARVKNSGVSVLQLVRKETSPMPCAFAYAMQSMNRGCMVGSPLRLSRRAGTRPPISSITFVKSVKSIIRAGIFCLNSSVTV